MQPDELIEWVYKTVTPLSFAWTQAKPELIQDFHKLALSSHPAFKDIPIPLDGPITSVDIGTTMRPSQIQAQLLTVVVPSLLPSIQAIAEDQLTSIYGDLTAWKLIERAFEIGAIDRSLASRAHHWRLARNVIAHGKGTVTTKTETEAIDLLNKRLIDFSEFKLWGSLLDAGHGGAPVPITIPAMNKADSPNPALTIPIKSGAKVDIGMVDLVASAEVWAAVIRGSQTQQPSPASSPKP